MWEGGGRSLRRVSSGFLWDIVCFLAGARSASVGQNRFGVVINKFRKYSFLRESKVFPKSNLNFRIYRMRDSLDGPSGNRSCVAGRRPVEAGKEREKEYINLYVKWTCGKEKNRLKKCGGEEMPASRAR